MTIASPPPAMPAMSARYPQSRPITSTRNARSCDEAVTFRRSMASSAILRAVSTPIVMSEPGRSLSIVEATPTTGNPAFASMFAPICEPFPPITTSPATPRALRTPSACSRPSGVLNASHRALPRIVPPCWMIPPTSRGPSGTSSPPRRPAKPWRTPETVHPCAMPARTTARIAAFMPGASPPLVRTARWLMGSPFGPASGGGGERPLGLSPGRDEVRDDSCAEHGEPGHLEPLLGREQDEAPEDERDECRQRVQPHAKRPREIRARLPEDERRRDLRDERDDRPDRHDGRDDDLEVQEREDGGRAAEREERDDGIALRRMQLREHREEVSIPRRGEEDARIAERQREHGRERGPQDEAGDEARDRPPREHRDEIRDRGFRAHGLLHREHRHDAGVHEDVEDRHREDRDDDDARNRLRGLDDLLGEITHVVVAEVVVPGEDPGA